MFSELFESGGKTYTVRRALEGDKQGFINLWRECFNDTEKFMDFFFSQRFIPDYSFCVEHNGTIVSAMHSMPLSLLIRGRRIPSTIVAGVGTSVNYRKLGLMHKMFESYMHYIKDMGILAVTYKPENYRTYEFLSHFSTTCTLKYSVTKAFPGVIGSPLHTEFISQLSSDEEDNSGDSGIEDIVITGDISGLQESVIGKCFKLYSLMAPAYSGIVDRTHENFMLKLSDYESSEGKFLMFFEGNQLLSYCFYFDTPDSLHAEEFIAKTDTALLKLLDRLHEISNGRKLDVKMPSNFSKLPESSFPDSDNVTLTDQNVLGVTDISRFVRLLNFEETTQSDILSGFVFDVTDPVFDNNNGIFNLMGEKSERNAFIKLDIGSFVRFLCGYYSIGDLEVYTPHRINISDSKTAEMVDKTILTCECFIVDEY